MVVERARIMEYRYINDGLEDSRQVSRKQGADLVESRSCGVVSGTGGAVAGGSILAVERKVLCV